MTNEQRETLEIHGASDVQPDWASLRSPTYVLEHLRSELTHCRLALAARNADVKALRSQVRLLNRVMRLKSECYASGVGVVER